MPSSYVALRAETVSLEAAPINSDWILSGAPVARAKEVARSDDGAACTSIWDCSAGTFRWYFGVDETVHILDGEVVVRDEAGRESTLRAGDVGFFPAGTWMVWRVDSYVRKVAYLRHPLPTPFGVMLRAFNHGMNAMRLRFDAYRRRAIA